MHAERSGQRGAPARAIDVNSDVGELPDPFIDAQLMELITSANVACGGHAGDHSSMLRACRLASDHNVAVGAQVSYPDRDGFGRRKLDITPEALHAAIARQFEELAEAASSAATQVRYIKPHGALYHAAIDDPGTAEAIVGLADTYRVPLLTLGFGELRDRADHARIPVFYEAFIDRGYQPDGRLTSRGEPDAILDDTAALDRLNEWVQQDFHGAHSLCVHSDTPDAVGLTRKVRRALADHDLDVRSFIGGPYDR
jgi:5-oxoprolinase (ATP-hydrolysing) subunit A